MRATSSREIQKKDVHKAQAQPALREVPLCEALRQNGEWATGSVAKVPEKSVYLASIKKLLIDWAQINPNLACLVVRGDKASLNNINKTGDYTGAGDAAMNLYMDILAQTIEQAYGSVCGNPFLLRDNLFSDETTIIASGDLRKMENITPAQFALIHREVEREYMQRLQTYSYNARKLRRIDGDWVGVKVPLNLEQYSRALKTPSLVARAHLEKSEVFRLEGLNHDFISEAVMRMEMAELQAVANLPDSFRPSLSFPSEQPNFTDVEKKLPENTVAIEIKFRHRNDNNRLAALGSLETTLKGVAEIYSNRFGLRYINTYFGKQVADRILAAVAAAMKDVDEGLRKVRKTDSNLIYVATDSNIREVEKLANKCLERRLREIDQGGQLDFEPSVTVIDSSDKHVNDLRAALALEGLNMGTRETEVFTYTDQLVSAAKIMKDEVVDKAISRLKGWARAKGIIVTRIIRECLDKNPAIRDTEDLVRELRRGDQDKPTAKEIEVWEFATQYGKQLRNRLIDVMSEL
jgi:hypothetical protein